MTAKGRTTLAQRLLDLGPLIEYDNKDEVHVPEDNISPLKGLRVLDVFRCSHPDCVEGDNRGGERSTSRQVVARHFGKTHSGEGPASEFIEPVKLQKFYPDDADLK